MKKKTLWALFGLFLAYFLAALLWWVSDGEAAVLTCGEDVPFVGTESHYADKFGLSPECYGKGVEPSVVIPGDAKARLKDHYTLMRWLQHGIKVQDREITDLKKRTAAMDKELAKVGKELEKALAAIRKPEAPSAKSAPVKNGKVAPKPQSKVEQPSLENFFLVSPVLSYSLLFGAALVLTVLALWLLRRGRRAKGPPHTASTSSSAPASPSPDVVEMPENPATPTDTVEKPVAPSIPIGRIT